MPEGRPSVTFGNVEDYYPGTDAEDPLVDAGPEAPPVTQNAAPPEPQAPVTEQGAPRAPAEAAVAGWPEGQPPEGSPAAPEAPAPEQPPQLYGGRFATVEALEQGWRDSDAFARRSASRANQAEATAQQVQAELADLKEELRQVAPLIQQGLRPAIDPAALERAGIDPESAGVLGQIIDAEVARRVAPVTQQIETDRSARAAEEEDRSRRDAITSFRERHPERTEEHEMAMVDLFGELGFDAADPSWYDIAYEATQRPALARVLRAHPDWAETDEGLEDARLLAAQHEGHAALAAQAATGSTPAAPTPAPGQGVHVLTGPSNAPPQGPGARDAIDEIVELDRRDRRSPFTGG